MESDHLLANSQHIERLRVGEYDWWVHGGVVGGAGFTEGVKQTVAGLREVIEGDGDVQRVFKDDRRSRVWLVSYEGRAWVVKGYRVAGWQTWLYHRVRRTPGWREWMGARRLAIAGCRVNEPLALVHRRGVLGCRQWLVFPYVEGHSLYHWLGGGDGEDCGGRRAYGVRRRVAGAVGRLIGQMIVAGVINRDLKPSNLIIDMTCERDGEMPVMIDLAGLRRRCGEGSVYQMLARFYKSMKEPGGVTDREALVCLRAVLAKDSTLAQGHRRRLRVAVAGIKRFYTHLRMF